MIKAKMSPRSAAVHAVTQPPPWTTAERLLRIESLGKRIDGYVQFICQSGNPSGASAESTDKAVTAFYEQMLTLERELARIQDVLKLQ